MMPAPELASTKLWLIAAPAPMPKTKRAEHQSQICIDLGTKFVMLAKRTIETMP